MSPARSGEFCCGCEICGYCGECSKDPSIQTGTLLCPGLVSPVTGLFRFLFLRLLFLIRFDSIVMCCSFKKIEVHQMQSCGPSEKECTNCLKACPDTEFFKQGRKVTRRIAGKSSLCVFVMLKLVDCRKRPSCFLIQV